MPLNIHYQVETKYWRRAVPNIHDDSHNDVPTKNDLVETQKEFHHENAMGARKAAFKHYSSIIEVLYCGLGIPQTTDKQARIDLQTYLDSGNGIEYLSKYPEKTFKINSTDMHNRIEIYMVVNGLKTAIHGVRYLDYTDKFDYDIIENMEGLFLEYKYYTKNNIATNNYAISIDFTPIGGMNKTFLQTPVNWEELVTEYAGVELIES